MRCEDEIWNKSEVYFYFIFLNNFLSLWLAIPMFANVRINEFMDNFGKKKNKLLNGRIRDEILLVFLFSVGAFLFIFRWFPVQWKSIVMDFKCIPCILYWFICLFVLFFWKKMCEFRSVSIYLLTLKIIHFNLLELKRRELSEIILFHKLNAIMIAFFANKNRNSIHVNIRLSSNHICTACDIKILLQVNLELLRSSSA